MQKVILSYLVRFAAWPEAHWKRSFVHSVVLQHVVLVHFVGLVNELVGVLVLSVVWQAAVVGWLGFAVRQRVVTRWHEVRVIDLTVLRLNVDNIPANVQSGQGGLGSGVIVGSYSHQSGRRPQFDLQV